MRPVPRGDPVTNATAAALLVGVFAAVIARQVLGRGPPVWALFGIGAALSVALEALTPAQTVTALAGGAPTIVFLFALFLFAAELDGAGAIAYLSRWIVSRARRPADVPLVLFVGIGLASTILVNDALVIIGVPLLVGLAARWKADPKPLLFTLAFAVTVGSALTPFGNPQNLLVAESSGVASPIAVFLRYLAIPVALGLMAGGLYVHRRFGPTMPASVEDPHRMAPHAPLLPSGGWGARLRAHPVLAIFPTTMVAIVGVDLAGSFTGGPVAPTWELAIAGALVLLVVSPDPAPSLRRLNYSILVLFAALFIVVAGAQAGGVIAALESGAPLPGRGHPTGTILAIIGASAGGAQLVSNVPWVALELPVLHTLGYGGGTPVVWMALAGASTLAGNVTLLGAASNLIIVDAAEQRGIRISLVEFVRYGAPLAAITLGILTAALLAGL